MDADRVRVGLIGLQPDRSWAARAHVPALRLLSDRFELVGVANSSLASSEAAAAACGLPRAFADTTELVNATDVDVVAVTVKVPKHFDLVRQAIEARKHVFCEWPLGNGLDEAVKLAELARSRGVLAVIGTQARLAPEILHLRTLLAEGHVGEVLSTTVTGWGRSWGPTVQSTGTEGYLLDEANGATLLSIPVGHTLAALRDVLGDLHTVSSVVTTRRRDVRSLDTGDVVPLAAPDQVVVAGRLAGGAPLALHYYGGTPPGGTDGLVWDIHGSDGDIRVTGRPTGHAQMVQLTLTGAAAGDDALRPIDIPADESGLPDDAISGNVARLWARVADDLKDGTSTAPTFDDAVALHRLLAAIEAASDIGTEVPQAALNRPLPQ